MPPSRRRPPPTAGQAPPVRRPRVAGLRNRPAARDSAPDKTPDTEPETKPDTARDTEPESMSGTLDADDTEPATEPPATTRDPEPDVAEDIADDSADDRDAVPADPDEDQADADDGVDDAAPAPARRPAGKRRAAGITRPADLSVAEARTKTRTETRTEADGARRARVGDDPRRRGATRLSVAVVLIVVAVVLAGLAVWFRGEADGLKSADSNTALTDSAATSEAIGQLKSAIEQTFSYNYTDLESTDRAVDSTLSGTARCQYDQLFSKVKQQAPKQKIVMVTAVRDIALVRLDGDRAEALVFIDQSSTRVDVNNSVAGEAQFAVRAHREGDTWKITGFDMFDQLLVNGEPPPKC
ncbi:hypothetical protein [Actinophytocola sp.]|uniref:hypothetical protein n=1 Tax=Actinophytocola sp. TaxID=1872138 RepID=UPI003D6B2038